MVQITIRKTVPVYTSEKQSYDLQLEVTAAADMPREIFVFKHGLQILPPPPVQSPAATPQDIFICIADPVALEEYPAKAPDGDPSNPYFRVACITLRFRSVLDLQRTWTYIMQDVQGLVDALNSSIEEGSSEDITFS